MPGEGEALGEADGDGDKEELALALGESEADTEELGERDGDADAEGDEAARPGARRVEDAGHADHALAREAGRFLRDDRDVLLANAARQAKRRIRHVAINEGQDQPERVYFKRVADARDAGLAGCPVCEPWEPA